MERRRVIALTSRDRELLAFLAEHRMVFAQHVAALLGIKVETAMTRLSRLASAGYVRSEPRFHHEPAIHLITSRGLKAIGSRVRAPQIDLRAYEHDAGVAWLWIAAQRGTFGPLQEVLGERRLRSHDTGRDPDRHPPVEPLAVRRAGAGPHGGERLHYPDLLLTTADGRRIALELELTPKTRTRLESILAGYGADPRIDGVVYLVESAAMARSVAAAARRVGMSDLVHLQRVELATSRADGADSGTAERVPPGRRAISGRSPSSAPSPGARDRSLEAAR